jgi:hypothetical protein
MEKSAALPRPLGSLFSPPLRYLALEETAIQIEAQPRKSQKAKF